MAARTTPDCRYALRNTELAIHHRNGETERQLLLSATEVQAVLASVFRLQLPQPALLAMELDKLLLRLSAAEQPATSQSPN
ncbi:hypothetical protein GCM10023189_47640 [Nibrella saemangeumensis]|uniref:Uncharacterized protein n=1 Tax=Nibrella saemangeumensis TaxID=1084526 RepID=A0ABP8NHP0_9BACT